MRIGKTWILARKDMKIIRRRWPLMIGLVALPLILGMGLPVVLKVVTIRRSVPVPMVENLMGSFGFFFVIFSVFLPLYISSYSLVGEKIEKSLEPLLSTPTSDAEILFGKYIGVFIPVILAIYLGSFVYMAMADFLISSIIGYVFFPNWSFAIIMIIAIPTACIYAISFSVFISSKVNSVQSAYNLGVFSVAPFIILYVMGELGIVSLNDDTNVLIISGVLLVAAILMYFISRATFNRENILTAWK